uniref:Uncharacterized protein n=1 Tax=Arundo donax TaxID=35708 RepID=A0A0A9ADC2_ARUDO
MHIHESKLVQLGITLEYTQLWQIHESLLRHVVSTSNFIIHH